MALPGPQGAMRLEEGGNQSVGGLVQPKDGLQQGGGEVDQGARMHGSIIPARVPNTNESDAQGGCR